MRHLLALCLIAGCAQAPETEALIAEGRHERPSISFDREEDLSLGGYALSGTTRNNSLGIWLWYLEGIGYTSHSTLAQDLAALGVKRIYVKVADGSYDPARWPEVDDPSIPAAYKAKGLEVFAWSYNYPRNEAAQARALTQAAKAGYQGYVTDIEVEFDAKTTELRNFMRALSTARETARNNGWAAPDFKLYSCTWGNPADHQMHVEIMDEYVDGHMPQTYVETWGGQSLANIPRTIAQGTAEYRQLGAKKPIFHVVSNERREISVSQLNTFFREAAKPANSGSPLVEVSLWRIPQRGDLIWSDIRAMDWNLAVANAQTLTVNGPTSTTTATTVTFTGQASAGVRKVVLTVDGYVINRDGATVSGTGYWTVPTTFTVAGNSRVVVATGYGADGTAVVTAQRTIQVTEPSSSFITASTPPRFAVGREFVIAGTASRDIDQIVASVDGFVLRGNGNGKVVVKDGRFAFPVTLNSAGDSRNLVLHGMNAAGNVTLFQLRRAIAVDAGFSSYFYQYNNAINPGGSCQNTSIAMILKHYGAPASETPDEISSFWGTKKAQTVAGFVEVFNKEAAFLGLSVRDFGSERSTLAEMKAELAAGRPVVVHGYFTDYGHVMVLSGYDALTNQYIAYDPAGKWNQRYAGGGYSKVNATEGRGVRYSAAAVEGAIVGNGEIWLHKFR
jgi:hypothetical protein